VIQHIAEIQSTGTWPMPSSFKNVIKICT